MTPEFQEGDIVYVAGDEWRHPWWIIDTVNSRYEGMVSFAEIRSTHQTLTVPLYALHLFPQREMEKEYHALAIDQLRETT